MSYCTIEQVVSEFPRFERNLAGGIQDDDIQMWIDTASARINAALIQRGIAPASLDLSTDQANWLQSLNTDYAVGRMGLVLQAQITLQPGEVSLAGQRLKQFDAVLNDVRAGRYDAFFGVRSRLWGSVGGAETERSTPAQRDENRAFGRNQEF